MENLVVVHLIRDPRARAYRSDNIRGALAAIKRLYAHGLRMLMIRYYALTRRDVAYILLRYEDLCEEPDESVKRVHALAGLEAVDLPFTEAGLVDEPHIIGGNHMNNEPIGAIRVSLSCLDGASRGWWLLITVLSLPLLALYRYPLRRNSLSRKYRATSMKEGFNSDS